MDKKTLINKIKTLLNVDIELASWTDEAGVQYQAEALEVGKVLNIVTPDGLILASAGEYVLDGLAVIVGEEGLIIEVAEISVPDPVPDPVPVPEEIIVLNSQETEMATLAQHNVLDQRILDLEEVTAQLTDALAAIKSGMTKPSTKTELNETKPLDNAGPSNRPRSTVDSIYQKLEFTNA